MLARTFETIDSLTIILNNPHLCPTRPNIEAIKTKIQTLQQKIENYLDGMGA